MREGFHINLYQAGHYLSYLSNIPSSREQSAQVSHFISEQLAQDYMIGPISPQDGASIIASPLAAIHKKATERWRIIVNLSSPQNASVNDNLRWEPLHIHPWRMQCYFSIIWGGTP